MKKLGFIFLLLASILSYAQKTETSIWYIDGYNEQTARKYLDNNYLLDIVEGIWQSTDGFKYAIEKDVEGGKRLSDKFRAVVLDSSHDGWKPGYIKGFITPGSVESVYSFKYYTRSRNEYYTESQNVLLIIESPVIMSFSRIDGGKVMLYRIYPQSDGSGQGSISIGNDEKSWAGSGVVIGDKYIATNNHVVEGVNTLLVKGVHGDMNTSYKVQVVVKDKNNDLAIVKVIDSKFDGFGQVPYGFRTSTADVGTEVFVLGYPLSPYLGDEVKATNGIISAKTGYQGDVTTYQMSAPIQSGNSGGPVFDNEGNLIGLAVSSIKSDVAQNVNYAVKLSYLQNLIESCNETIELSSTNILSSFSLPDKIKAISPFVLLFQANVGDNNAPSNNAPITDNERQDAERSRQKAIEKFEKEDYDGAYIDICNSVRFGSTNENQYMRGYLALFHKKDLNTAIESFQYCIENNYLMDKSIVFLGDCYLEQEEYDKAIQQFNKAIESDRRNVDAYFGRALCEGKKGQHLEALQDYKQALKYEGLIEADYATIYNNIAWEYRLIEKYTEAKPYIDKALLKNHMKDYIWDTNAEIAYHLGDYYTCLTSENNAITLNKDRKNLNSPYYYRGLAKIQLNNKAGGIADLRKAKDLGETKADSVLSILQKESDSYSSIAYQERIIKNPLNINNISYSTKITAIEQTEEFVAVYITIHNNTQEDSWISVDPNSFMIDKDTDNKGFLLKVEGCTISPKKKEIRKEDTIKLVLYFPAISSGCKMVDLSLIINENNEDTKIDNELILEFYSGEIIVTSDVESVIGLSYVCDITEPLDTSKKVLQNYKKTIEKLQKKAKKTGCCLILITNINKEYVTARLYKQ